MKQKDLLVLIVVACVSAVFSLVLSNMFFSSPKNRSQQVEVVDAITSEFPKPNEKYFNNQSVDPAQPVQIGDGNNPNPFNGQP
jgi:hypothetical protein